MTFMIEGRLAAELTRLTKLRAPNEAVGIILSDQTVVELPNLSESPHDSFVVDKQSVIQAVMSDNNLEEVAFWHSHPAGGVGPSRLDMQRKTVFNNHLVTSLVGDEIIPSWY